jgi:TolA-binding protein
MEKMMTYCVLALLLVSVALLTCSNNKEPESESEKGTIEKMTDKAAKEMVNRIRTPINKARSVKDQQEDRLNDMDESVKDLQ